MKEAAVTRQLSQPEDHHVGGHEGGGSKAQRGNRADGEHWSFAILCQSNDILCYAPSLAATGLVSEAFALSILIGLPG